MYIFTLDFRCKFASKVQKAPAIVYTRTDVIGIQNRWYTCIYIYIYVYLAVELMEGTFQQSVTRECLIYIMPSKLARN